MNVIQLFTTVDPDALIAAHNELYPNTPMSMAFWHDRFMPLVRKKVLVETGMTIEIDHEKSIHDDQVDDDESYHTSVIIKGEPFSMSFIGWGEILAADVNCNVHFSFSLEHQAACIVWEMTWFGLEEEMIEKRDELDDRMTQLDRDLEEGDDKAFTTLDAFLDDFEGPKGTPKRDEHDARVQSMIANMKTLRFYKNGVLQPSRFIDGDQTTPV